MPMTLLQELQVSDISFSSFPPFHFSLHYRQITAEFEFAAIAKPNIVIRLALYQFHSFSFQTCVKFCESLVEESWEE
jgi:hypothetical protein